MSTKPLPSHEAPTGSVRLPTDWFIQPVITAAEAFVDSNLEVYGIHSLWKHSKGKGVKVAVLDTGYDAVHPSLRHVLPERTANFTPSPHGMYAVNPHGCWCAGIIGARGDYTGIAPETDLFVGKCLDDTGNGSTDGIARAIRWANNVGVDIISASFGGIGLGIDVVKAVREFVDRGGIFIASAGNNGQGRTDTMTEPAIFDNVISVGACDWQGTLAPFSSIGPALDFVMPGVNVVSTIPVARGSFGRMSGTSMAAPMFAAFAALCLSKHRDPSHPNRTPIEVPGDLANNYKRMMEHLQQATIDKGKPGRDDLYGWGLIDPDDLADDWANADPPIMPPPTTPPISAVDGELVWQYSMADKTANIILTKTKAAKGDYLRLT